jgi:competence protein ComEC
MSVGAHIPLARLIVPFTAGILAYLTASCGFPSQTFLYTYLLLFISGILARKVFSSIFSGRWVFGAWAFVFLFTAGYHISQNHHQLRRPDHFSRFADAGGLLLLRVQHPVAEKANSFQVIAGVERVMGDSLQQNVSGKLMLYLEKDSLAAGLRYGDYLLVKNDFREVQAPRNPGEFNFQQFLAHRNIFHQCWRPKGTWQKTGESKGFFVVKGALALREQALEVFRKQGLGDREFAVVSALVLGYREYLDEDLQREFAGAGAMHVLCVSGLHVGIIYLVMKFLLGFLRRFRQGRSIQTALLLLMLWFYAAITGFSPSVLRATIMFSFVAVGQGLGRTTSVYNNLAASALLLMIVNPWIVTQVGFQMSYLAVFSIVALQPFFYRLLSFKNFLLDKAWALLCVSLAAQLATGPLSLYYFHQFPNYFLITNLIVVPLAGLIIYAALGALVFSVIPLLGALSGKLLFGLVFLVQHAVHFIEGLPHSTLNGVYINLPEVMVLLLLLFFLGLFLVEGRRKMLPLALITILLVMTSFSVRSILNLKQQSLVVYAVNRAGAIDFIGGKLAICLICADQEISSEQMVYQTEGNRLRLGVRNVLPVHVSGKEASLIAADQFSCKGPFIHFGEKNLFVLNQECPKEFPAPGFPIDYLIINNNPRHDPQKILECLLPGLVIVDGSNYHWMNLRWEEACKLAGIECWNVWDKGAYQADLSRGNPFKKKRRKDYTSL